LHPGKPTLFVLTRGEHHWQRLRFERMNNEGPTPLNYATPAVRVHWRWPWWKRLGVAILVSIVHFSSGLWVIVFDIRLRRFPALFLFPLFHLTERLWDSYGGMLAVAVGQSLLIGVLLAALFERISRYLHRPKE
jgi:hypothetical protein